MPRVKSVSSNTPEYPVASGTSSGRVTVPRYGAKSSTFLVKPRPGQLEGDVVPSERGLTLRSLCFVGTVSPTRMSGARSITAAARCFYRNQRCDRRLTSWRGDTQCVERTDARRMAGPGLLVRDHQGTALPLGDRQAAHIALRHGRLASSHTNLTHSRQTDKTDSLNRPPTHTNQTN